MALAARSRERMKSRVPQAALKTTGKRQMGPDRPDANVGWAIMEEAFGTNSRAVVR